MAFYFALMNVSNKKERRRSSSRASHSSSFYETSHAFPSAPSNSFESICGSLSQGEGTPNSIVPSSTASFPPPVRTSKKVRFKPQSPTPSLSSSSPTTTRNYFLGESFVIEHSSRLVQTKRESPSLTTLSASDHIRIPPSSRSRDDRRSVLNRFISLIVPSRKATKGINRSASAERFERVQHTHRENGRSVQRVQRSQEYNGTEERSMERERRSRSRRGTMERRRSESELDSEDYWAEYDE